MFMNRVHEQHPKIDSGTIPSQNGSKIDRVHRVHSPRPARVPRPSAQRPGRTPAMPLPHACRALPRAPAARAPRTVLARTPACAPRAPCCLPCLPARPAPTHPAPARAQRPAACAPSSLALAVSRHSCLSCDTGSPVSCCNTQGCIAIQPCLL